MSRLKSDPMQQISERILLTIWIGAMWTVGYIVAPTLFAMIEDRTLAGAIAGRLFMVVSFIGIFSSIFLLFTMAVREKQQILQQWRSWVLIFMLIIIVVGEFILQPLMAALRQDGISPAEKTQFGMLHGIASVLFLINSLAGLILVIFGLQKTASVS